MSLFFLPDPLGDPAIRPSLGEAGEDVVPAAAAGHELRLEPGALRLALVPSPGAQAGGRLIDGHSPAADAARDLLGAMGGCEARIEARLADGSSTIAETCVAAAGPPGDRLAPAALAADLMEQLREALHELLAQPGDRDRRRLASLLPAVAARAAARVRGAARRVPRRLGSAFDPADLETLAVDWRYGAFFAVEEHRLRHRRFDGGLTAPLERGVFTSGDAVTVLPFDPRQGTVLMVEQFRIGPAARLDPRPWSIEAIAGRCDGLEAPETTARREAGEEAGLRLGRLERAAAYYTSPGIAAEFITSFVGEADLAGAGGLHGLAEEDEDIRALVVPLDAALAAAESGEIANAPLLVSLFWLARHRQRLVAAWATASAATAAG